MDKNSQYESEVKNKFKTRQIDLERFVLLCSNHLVLPAIYIRLHNAGLFKYFPMDFENHLKDIYHLNKKRNNEILLQIEELSDTLLIHNIEPIYLKGTGNLMDNLYSDISDRMIGDIDLLVKEKDYFKTADLILKLGYKQEEVKIFDELNLIRHYPRLFRDDVPADIEIHRTPVDNRYTRKFNSDIIFNKKITIPTIQNCFVPNDKHKLIHTFIHSQLSDNGYSIRITSLRDLFDFYLLTQKIDFKTVLPKIEEKRKAEVFFNFANRMFGSEKHEIFERISIGEKYYRQYIWFLNHPKQHRVYINILKMFNMFVERPYIKIKNAILNKSSRKSLIKRLKNPDWYTTIYHGIKLYFK
jgi:hypothetical protein